MMSGKFDFIFAIVISCWWLLFAIETIIGWTGTADAVLSVCVGQTIFGVCRFRAICWRRRWQWIRWSICVDGTAVVWWHSRRRLAIANGHRRWIWLSRYDIATLLHFEIVVKCAFWSGANFLFDILYDREDNEYELIEDEGKYVLAAYMIIVLFLNFGRTLVFFIQTNTRRNAGIGAYHTTGIQVTRAVVICRNSIV